MLALSLNLCSLCMVTAAIKLKKLFLLGRKTMTNLDSLLKRRDVTLPMKVHIVKATVFPIVMCRYELGHKGSERRRVDAFQLWSWRRLLRIPWTARRSNHSNRKESNPEYSLERLMLILQFFGHLIWKAIGKDCDTGKAWNQKQMGAAEDEIVWYHHPLNGHILEQTPGGSGIQRNLMCCSPWGHRESGTT